MSYLVKIRNRDGVVADFIYRTYKSLQRFNVSPIPGLYHALAYERSIRRAGLIWIKRKFYDEPLFKLRCTACGEGLHLEDGIPEVYGELDLRLGKHVTMHGTTSIGGSKVFRRPRLTIGDRTHVGSQFTASVGADITIGNDVLIANRVNLFAYDGHPLDMVKRAQNLPAAPETSKPIVIEDNAWLGSGVFVMKGVRIGRGAIIAAGSVVTRDVPPFCIAAGNPAKVVRRITPEGTPVGTGAGASDAQPER